MNTAAYDVHYRIKAAQENAIKALDLAGDEVFTGIGQRVYNFLFPDSSPGILFPCVQLTSEGERESRDGGDSLSVIWRYPTRIWIMDTESPRRHAKERLYMMWRKAIIGLFDQTKMPSIKEMSGGMVVPDVIFDEKLPQYQAVVSGMVVWTTTTELRNG